MSRSVRDRLAMIAGHIGRYWPGSGATMQPLRRPIRPIQRTIQKPQKRSSASAIIAIIAGVLVAGVLAVIFLVPKGSLPAEIRDTLTTPGQKVAEFEDAWKNYKAWQREERMAAAVDVTEFLVVDSFRERWERDGRKVSRASVDYTVNRCGGAILWAGISNSEFENWNLPGYGPVNGEKLNNLPAFKRLQYWTGWIKLEKEAQARERFAPKMEGYREFRIRVEREKPKDPQAELGWRFSDIIYPNRDRP